MKQLALTFFFSIVVAGSLSAQFKGDLSEVDSTACMSDTTQQIYFYKYWQVYQTLENTWNGTTDDSQCINLRKKPLTFGSGYYYTIDLTTIDQSRSLYVKFKMDKLSEPYFLASNLLIEVAGNMFPEGIFDLDFSDQCNEGMCSGLLLFMKAWDTNATDTIFSENLFPFTALNNCTVAACGLTEKTEFNQVTDVLYKISFPENANDDASVGFTGVDAYEKWDVNYIEEDIIVPEVSFSNGAYQVFYDIFDDWWAPGLVLHREEGLPSPDNISITSFNLEENQSTPQTINFYLDEYASLYYQSYTQLMGGLVEGSDSLRHHLTIINNSFNMCVSIVELVFERGTNFEFRSENINFSNLNGCFQFRNDAKMIIGAGTALNYGEQGVGNLSLRPGGTIEFKQNSQLNFNGKLILTTYEKFNGEQEVSVHLPKGSKINFGEHAKITNEFGGLKLKIYMEGGVVDASKLDAESREKIELIYPERSVEDQFVLVQNPVKEIAMLYNANQIMIQDIKLFNLNGALIMNQKIDADNSYLEIDVSTLQSQIYLLELTTESGTEIHKMMVL